MAEEDKKALLVLSTSKYVGHVKIDNVKYGLIKPGKLSPTDHNNMELWGKSLSTVARAKSTKSIEAHGKTIDKILCIIMPEIKVILLDKLSLMEKIAIVNAYHTALGSSKKKARPMKKA